MKKMTLALLCLISFSIFAGVGGSTGGNRRESQDSIFKRLVTLQDFDASKSHIVQWPTIIFSNLSVPVKNVCVDGSTLKTITPVKFCSKPAIVKMCFANNNESNERCVPYNKEKAPRETSRVHYVWGCEEFSSHNFETSKFYESSVCTRWKEVGHDGSRVCVEFEKVTNEYENSFDVQVSGTSIRNNNDVAHFDFDLPDCTFAE